MRSLLVAITAFALVPAGLAAAEIRGQITSIDASKNRLTLTVDGKERTIECTAKCRITTMVENNRRIFPRRTSVQEYLTSLDQLQMGSNVTVMLETMDGSEMATSIQANSTSGSMTTTSNSSGGRLRIFRR